MQFYYQISDAAMQKLINNWLGFNLRMSLDLVFSVSEHECISYKTHNTVSAVNVIMVEI